MSAIFLDEVILGESSFFGGGTKVVAFFTGLLDLATAGGFFAVTWVADFLTVVCYLVSAPFFFWAEATFGGDKELADLWETVACFLVG